MYVFKHAFLSYHFPTFLFVADFHCPSSFSLTSFLYSFPPFLAAFPSIRPSFFYLFVSVFSTIFPYSPFSLFFISTFCSSLPPLLSSSFLSSSPPLFLHFSIFYHVPFKIYPSLTYSFIIPNIPSRKLLNGMVSFIFI